MRTHRYGITIAGSLGQTGREAFADFGIAANGHDTVLTGTLDQAALVWRAHSHPFARPGTRGTEPAGRRDALRRTAVRLPDKSVMVGSTFTAPEIIRDGGLTTGLRLVGSPAWPWRLS